MKSALEESLVQILSPHRRVDILRDVMAAQHRGQPYSVTFCGVNGVGKSTNLAKVLLMHEYKFLQSVVIICLFLLLQFTL